MKCRYSVLMMALVIFALSTAALSGQSFSPQSERKSLARKLLDDEVRPEQLVEKIGVQSGMAIGEAGAGGGYFTFYLARKVGREGHIYANDIERKRLEFLDQRQSQEGVANITIVLGEVEDPLFPVKNLDMIVMLRAYHEFENKVAWLKNARKYLKPGSPVVIVDYTDDSGRVIPREEVENEARQAGYELTLFENFRPELNIAILKAPQKA